MWQGGPQQLTRLAAVVCIPRESRAWVRVMVREMNPPTRCKQIRHSMGTLSAHSDSLADIHHLTYVNCINFD